MDLEFLAQFLVNAKLNTYAKSGEEGETILPDGRKQFEFSAGDFRYLDIYSGFNPFTGQEVVSYQSRPVWQMSYKGEVTDKNQDAKQVYHFLKKVLSQITTNKPFRGPEKFMENNFKYINEVKGDIKKFQGTEMIYLNDQEVY